MHGKLFRASFFVAINSANVAFHCCQQYHSLLSMLPFIAANVV